MSSSPDPASLPLYQDHTRRFAGNRFVYPVLSRRSGGISLGVNLNPDKICNFDCIYCQVDRTRQSETTFVETPALLAELDRSLASIVSGEIYASDKFRHTPEPQLNRVATGFYNTEEEIDRLAKAIAAIGDAV